MKFKVKQLAEYNHPKDTCSLTGSKRQYIGQFIGQTGEATDEIDGDGDYELVFADGHQHYFHESWLEPVNSELDAFKAVWGESGELPNGGSWFIGSDGVIQVDDSGPEHFAATAAYLTARGARPADPRETVLKQYGFTVRGDLWRLQRGGENFHVEVSGPTELHALIDTPEKVEAFCTLMGITK